MERLPTSRKAAEKCNGRRAIVGHFYILARMDRRVRVNTVVCARVEHDPSWRWYQFDFHNNFGGLCFLEILSSLSTVGRLTLWRRT